MDLMGKTAVITGGTTGIGFATAKLFLAEGARVAITGQDEVRLAEARRALGGDLVAIRADVRSASDLTKLRVEAERELGRIDALFVNAGVAYATPIGSTTAETYDTLMDVNVKGAFFTIQALLPLVNDGGAIVLNTSWLDDVGVAGLSILSASKAAVRSFARTLSAELIDRRIRVNAVSPGAIATPIHAKTGMSPAALEAFAAKLTASIPIGRFGQADEVAAAVLFLASARSSYVLGAELVVDGGFSQL